MLLPTDRTTSLSLTAAGSLPPPPEGPRAPLQQHGPGRGPGSWRSPSPIASPAQVVELIVKNKAPGHMDKKDLIAKELACL